MSIVKLDMGVARSHFLKMPFRLEHSLKDHPLFELSQLVCLAKSLPQDAIEYNSGAVAVGARPDQVPKIDLSAEEVIKSIESASAWMVIKSVEQQPAYKALLEAFVREANAAAGRQQSDYSDLKGFIFVSSAKATTPFHLDAEENILIQIRGDKFVRTFDNADRTLISEESMELSPAKHRNQRYEDWYEQRATLHALKPGDAVHIPYMVPHWVGTGDAYSISMAMTWKTPEVVRLNKIRFMNGTLRRLRWPQRPPGEQPMIDATKVAIHDLARAAIDPLRKTEAMRRILRKLIYGGSANYYYRTKPEI